MIMIPTSVFHSIVCCVAILLSSCNSDGQKKTAVIEKEEVYYTGRPETTRTYYYFWTAHHGTTSSWGEYSFESDTVPTYKQIRKMIYDLNGDDWHGKKYLKIEMVQGFNTKEEYHEWHQKQPIAQIAYDLYRYRKNDE